MMQIDISWYINSRRLNVLDTRIRVDVRKYPQYNITWRETELLYVVSGSLNIERDWVRDLRRATDNVYRTICC